jgi:cell wall-associated NlpC family hydrolase
VGGLSRVANILFQRTFRSRAPARLEASRARVARAAGLALLGVLLCVLTAAPASGNPPPADGGQLQDAQEQASQLSAQVEADGARLEVLDQQYEAAQQQVQTLDTSILQTGAQITVTQASVSFDEGRLRQQALALYTAGQAAGQLTQLFAPPESRSSLVDQYQQVASSNVSDTVDTLRVAQATLAQQQAQLQSAEAKAKASMAQIGAAQAQAQQIMESEQSELNSADGQVAVLVAQNEAAEAQQAAAAAAPAPDAGAVADAPVAPGAAGAVQAAESQLGVPYVWGGETPGEGFDCSGLTQWAWGQAGVSLPRTAQDQYDAIDHISMSDLEPGDLLFWNDGTDSIQHVAMYVGNNEVIQAPYTGAVVSYSPIWPSGLVGAGRP